MKSNLKKDKAYCDHILEKIEVFFIAKEESVLQILKAGLDISWVCLGIRFWDHNFSYTKKSLTAWQNSCRH